MVTCASGVIFGSLALALDVGWAYFRRETAQAAADAAAIAAVRAAINFSSGGFTCGSSKVWCGGPSTCPSTPPGTASSSFDNACMMASKNGLSTSAVTVQANTTTSVPTVSGPTVAYWATARVSDTATPWFGYFMGTGITASVRSSAAAVTGSGSGGCLYVLDPHAAQSFLAGNNAQVKIGCGVYVNSDANANNAAGAAMYVTGSAKITAPAINIVGSYYHDNNGSTSTTPSTGTTAVADPFASLPSPSTSGSCQSGNFTSWQPTQYTPAPGLYCGFSLGNGMNAQLSGGTYIISGGTFSIQGGSKLTATGGVMIYLTGGATVNIANGTTVTLSAQTSGPYQGILFYQDRSVASPGTSYFAGGATMNFTGSLYFPHSLLNVDNGTNTTGSTMAIVANKVNFQGGANFLADNNGSKTGISGGYTLYLLE